MLHQAGAGGEIKIYAVRYADFLLNHSTIFTPAFPMTYELTAMSCLSPTQLTQPTD
jgi:hypothetical protein